MLKKLFRILLLVCAVNCCATTNLYVFKSQQYIGDNDQLQGAANAITKDFAKHNIPINLIETAESNILVKENSRALFSSVDGVAKWARIKSQHANTFSIFLTHQWWSKLLQTFSDKDSLSLIVAPQSTITSRIQESAIQNHIQLLGINGVCSSLHKDDLIKAYQSSSIPRNKAYTLVLLAGDTQDSAGKWKFFTEKDAIKLAKVITRHYLASKQTILVTNGPRTGKIDSITGRETSAHKGAAIDSISKAFLAELARVVPYNKIQFYNFVYNQPSILPAAMGAVLLNSGSYFYVSGESISTASQALSLLPAHSILLYIHSAMLDIHRAYVAQELKLGCASIISESGEKIIAKTLPSATCSINQCDQAAAKVYEFWHKF